MQLKEYPGKHFTYCTNIHPGENWGDVFNQLKSNIPTLKKRLAPSDHFGIGLRLSATASIQLLEKDRLDTFKKWLDDKGLYVFTINGFPYGDFHQQHIKDLVYKPDWRTQERLDYTLNLIEILAALVPQNLDGGISTSPLSYKKWLTNPSLKEQVFEQSTKNLAIAALKMHEIKEGYGKQLHLDIEPEPDCLLENTQETIDFFTDWLFPIGSSFLSKEYGFSVPAATKILRNHVSVCYDTCHFAVEYENPKKAVKAFKKAGIKIGKTQISSALKVPLDVTETSKRKAITELKKFEESTYLHQVIEQRSNGSFHHYHDLSEALSQANHSGANEWRIHYHVPIFMNDFDKMDSTQDDIQKALKVLLEDDECNHFEIETYTWEVLPDSLKVSILDSIEREFKWLFQQLNILHDN